MHQSVKLQLLAGYLPTCFDTTQLSTFKASTTRSLLSEVPHPSHLSAKEMGHSAAQADSAGMCFFLRNEPERPFLMFHHVPFEAAKEINVLVGFQLGDVFALWAGRTL